MNRSVALLDLGKAADSLVGQIPAGRVAAAGDIARALGDAKAAAWIGARRRTLAPHSVSWRRVVLRGGGLPGDRDELRSLVADTLASEGLDVVDDRVEGFGAARFTRLGGSQPLAQLQDLQNELAGRLNLSSPELFDPATIAGVDVSYAGEQGVAAYVEYVSHSPEIAWSRAARQTATFPYITSYLAFREFGLFAAVLDEVRTSRPLADLLLVDGSGVLHPRRAGSSCFVGEAYNLPTVGVTKRLLCGRVDEESKQVDGGVEFAPVRLDGEVSGWAVWASTRSRRPVFLSPAWKMDAATIRRLAPSWFDGRKTPRVIHAADALSRKYAREVLRA